jgi:hypothetical protein
MPPRYARAVFVLPAVAVVLSVVAFASAEKPPIVCVQNLEVTAGGPCEEAPFVTAKCFAGELPKTLPRKTSRRVSAYFSCKVDYSDLSSPLRVTEEMVALDRNVSVDTTGLPACGRKSVEALDTKAARGLCGAAIVGEGRADVVVPSLSPSPTRLRLTLFNAGTRNGTTKMFIHAAPAVGASSETLIAPVRISEAREGRYGLRAVTRFPAIAGGEGALVYFELGIGNGHGSAGPPSVAFARCPDDHLQARMETVVSDGSRLMSPVIRSCS